MRRLVILGDSFSEIDSSLSALKEIRRLFWKSFLRDALENSFCLSTLLRKNALLILTFAFIVKKILKSLFMGSYLGGAFLFYSLLKCKFLLLMLKMKM